MKRAVNNEEVAKLWTMQTQSFACNSTGNFCFHGKTIYSYGEHFPIATIHTVNGKSVVAFTTRGYSQTTAKHKAVVHRAIAAMDPQMPIIHVDDPTKAL